MSDEFGGIPVDEPRTDEFGGVAIAEEPQAMPKVALSPYEKARLSGMEPVAGPFGPANPQEVLELGKAVQQPFIPLPETTAKGPLAAAYRSIVKPVIEGIESPAGVLMAPLLAEYAPLRVAAGVGFGAMAAKSGLEKMQSPDPQTQLEGRMELAGAPLLALSGGGREKVTPRLKEAPQVKPAPLEPIPEIAPTEEVPPISTVREAQPSAGPIGETMETPVAAGVAPQAVPEPKPKEDVGKAEYVTTPVTEGGVGPGMGGALAKGEIPETGAGGEKYGVAARVRAERAQAGQVEPVEPGVGINTPDSITRGREIIRSDPPAPERMLSEFEQDPQKRVSTDMIAATRAHGEALAAGARTIEEQFGTESPQYQAAKGALSDWDKRTKPLQTEWHKQGMAQQGETDIDTGSFTGLNRAYEASTGKQIAPAQKPRAKKIAADNKAAQDAEADASEKLNARIREKNPANAEKAAIDAANKTVRDAAARMAQAENKARVAEEVRRQAEEQIQKLAQPDTTASARSEAIRLAREENARRIKQATANNEAAKVQLEAAKKALKSAEDVVRQAAIRAAREDSRVKSTGITDDQSIAAQRALDTANKVVKEHAYRVSQLENRSRVAAEVLKNEITRMRQSREQAAKEAADKTVREAAIRKAREENKARVTQAQRDKDIANVQVNAAKSALDAAQKVERDVRERAMKEAQRRAADPSIAVWEAANKYLEENKGFYSFDDIRNKVAADLGMPVSKVTSILAQDATTKRLAVDLWNKQRNSRRLKEQAKIWIRELDTPGYQKALATIPRAMFSLSVFGHGFVALGTHAPIVAFQPRFWNAYVRNFGRMYRLVFSPSYYEAQMQDLVRRPNYEVARRAGLQNDPFKYEEFHTTAIKDMVKGWIGEKNMDRVDKATSGGNRGYSVLKVIRQDMFDQAWNRLPKSIQVQEGVAAALSDGINHATGVTAKAAPKGSNIALFAPRLAGSRVMWLGGDPIRAGNTILNWKKATTAEKQFAINQMKEKAWVFGTFASLLAINQGVLSASGSNQKINGVPESLGGAGFDPLAGDFMKFKAAGANIAYGGALLTLTKLPIRVATAILYEGKGSKYILEDERVSKVIGSYLRSQASPFAGTIADLALGRDYEERPLPAKMFGTVEQTGAVPKRLIAQGVDEPYTWAEFAATKLPIPVAEGIKEGLKGSGMPDEQVNYWLKAWAITSIMTGTGTRITEDTREE